MNTLTETQQKIRDFKEMELLKLLNLCTDPQRLLFKRMYSHKNLDAPLHEVVSKLSDDKFDNAIAQCDRTIINNLKSQ